MKAPHLQCEVNGFFKTWWQHHPACWCKPGASGHAGFYTGHEELYRWRMDPNAGDIRKIKEAPK